MRTKLDIYVFIGMNYDTTIMYVWTINRDRNHLVLKQMLIFQFQVTQVEGVYLMQSIYEADSYIIIRQYWSV